MGELYCLQGRCIIIANLFWHVVQGLANVDQHPDQPAHLVLHRADSGLLQPAKHVQQFGGLQSCFTSKELAAMHMRCWHEGLLHKGLNLQLYARHSACWA